MNEFLSRLVQYPNEVWHHCFAQMNFRELVISRVPSILPRDKTTEKKNAFDLGNTSPRKRGMPSAGIER